MESTERTIYQHYEVERRPDGSLYELGRGAMGITYKALDSNLRVPVALKVITGALLPDARARSRFLREARAAAQLRHSNVATVYHLGQEADFCFYTMEFVDGETCDTRVHREGPLDPVTALRICSQVARALQAAHSRGLLHRDLKPSNLMVAQEGGDLLVKVIDFGLVKPLQQDDAEAGASLSGGLFLGTPLYASPEQCASEETLDGRSDLYSLGATLWFLLTGEPLFKGSMRSVMAQHLTKPPPLEVLRGQPAAVTALLNELLAKDPDDRPADAGALRVRIAEVLRELETQKAASASTSTSAQPQPAAAVAPAAAGFTLEDILRKRGCLLPGEAVFLLPRLAALLDHVSPGEPLPDLAPRNVEGHFTSGEKSVDAASLFGLPLREWPPFTLGIDTTLPASTIALAPTDGTLLQPAENLPADPVEALAYLVYELLNGSPLLAGRPYRPLTVLSESGNTALRRALPFGPQPGYAGTKDFCATLARALDGSSSTALPVRPLEDATAENTVLMNQESVAPPVAFAQEIPLPIVNRPPPPPPPLPPSELSSSVVEGPAAPLAAKRFPGWLIPVGVAALLMVAALVAVLKLSASRSESHPSARSQPSSNSLDSRPQANPPPNTPSAPPIANPVLAAASPFIATPRPPTPPTTPATPAFAAEPTATPAETPALGNVAIESDPSGASVIQGSRTLGRTPLTLSQQPAGKMTLRIEAPGYEPRTISGNVPAGGTLALSPALTKKRPPQDAPPPPEPTRPPRKSNAATADAGSGRASQGKSSVREMQRKAIELQHKNGALSDQDYQHALRDLGN